MGAEKSTLMMVPLGSRGREREQCAGGFTASVHASAHAGGEFEQAQAMQEQKALCAVRNSRGKKVGRASEANPARGADTKGA